MDDLRTVSQILFGVLVVFIGVDQSLVGADKISLDETSLNDTTEFWTWDVSDWSACHFRRSDGVSSGCARRRSVTCVFSGDWSPVPPFYCHRYAAALKPDTEEPCVPCRRPCVLGEWEEWQACRCGKRVRTRAVLLLPPGDPEGLECAATVEETVCDAEEGNGTCAEQYEWRHGEWSSCHLVSKIHF